MADRFSELRTCHAAPLMSGCLTILFAGLLTGCATVAPYEREELTKPTMDMTDEGSELVFRAHVQESREGSVGGAETSGGGCGCN